MVDDNRLVSRQNVTDQLNSFRRVQSDIKEDFNKIDRLLADTDKDFNIMPRLREARFIIQGIIGKFNKLDGEGTALVAFFNSHMMHKDDRKSYNNKLAGDQQNEQ